MTCEQFHNALRIMRSIDMPELVNAGVIKAGDDAAYRAFANDPFRWFIYSGVRATQAVYKIIEDRQPARLKDGANT